MAEPSPPPDAFDDDPPTAAAPLPPALAVLPGPRAAIADCGESHMVQRGEATGLLQRGRVMVAHASLTARRLGLAPPPRTPEILDVLELFAFVRPARFTAPSPAGLAQALGLNAPHGAEGFAAVLAPAAEQLLAELADPAYPGRNEALSLAESLRRAGWGWGASVVAALRSQPIPDRQYRGSGLDVWTRLPEWEESAPQGEPGTAPITAEAAKARLAELLARSGLDEARPAQAEFAAEAAFAFSPRDQEGHPRMMLAEAGTGVGKTLG